MTIRIEDKALGKVVYLFPTAVAAESHATVLSYGRPARCQVVPHPSALGWYLRDTETGRLYDAQGLVQ